MILAILQRDTYLSEWLDLGGHMEVELAQFARLCVRTFDPLLQTTLMNELETATAYTWRDHRSTGLRCAMTDPAQVSGVRCQRRHGPCVATTDHTCRWIGRVPLEGLLCNKKC